jgi:hypothetical protein
VKYVPAVSGCRHAARRFASLVARHVRRVPGGGPAVSFLPLHADSSGTIVLVKWTGKTVESWQITGDETLTRAAAVGDVRNIVDVVEAEPGRRRLAHLTGYLAPPLEVVVFKDVAAMK